MKKFAELGHVHRGSPCEEYPGSWLVFASGNDIDNNSFVSFEDAWSRAHELVNADADKVSICWQASDNDPRVGMVWFTGFYQHGRFDLFGNYKS